MFQIVAFLLSKLKNRLVRSPEQDPKLSRELGCLDVSNVLRVCEVYRIDDSALMEAKKKSLKLVF